MEELMSKAEEVINNQLDAILKKQRAGREVQDIAIHHALDALYNYRRIQSRLGTSPEAVKGFVRKSMNDTIQELQHKFSS